MRRLWTVRGLGAIDGLVLLSVVQVNDASNIEIRVFVDTRFTVKFGEFSELPLQNQSYPVL